MNPEVMAALKYAGRVFAYGVAVAYLNGLNNWPGLVNAGIAALAAVIVKAGNPGDPEFGVRRV